MEALKAKATIPPVRAETSIKIYYRTLAQLAVTANAYGRESKMELQYIFLTKFSKLFLALREHPEFKSKKYARERKRFKQETARVLSELEVLHHELTTYYEARATAAASTTSTHQVEPSAPPPPAGDSDEDALNALGEFAGDGGRSTSTAPGRQPPLNTVSPAASTTGQLLGADGGDGGGGGSKLRLGTNFAGFGGSATGTPAVTSTAEPSTPAYPAYGEVSAIEPYVPNADQQRFIEEQRAKELEQVRAAEAASLASYQAAQAAAAQAAADSRLLMGVGGGTAGFTPATLPAMNPHASMLGRPTGVGAAAAPITGGSAGVTGLTGFTPSAGSTAASLSTPTTGAGEAETSGKRKKKKRRRGGGDAAAEEPMRRVVIWMDMLSQFLRMAEDNTRNNLETCGILAGTLHDDVLYCTHLIIPNQEATSDTVHTTDEESLWEYQMTNDLLTLGWIHTHPTQQVFLSSVDLHTHCAYQSMLPEAIAIVMAPRYRPNYGIFQLTTPDGLDLIQNCDQRGFHPHPDHVVIYEHSTHVRIAQGVPNLEVVDLRT